MAAIELSLNVNYLPGWKVWEGIRELVQNGRDAEVLLNAPLTVTHHGQSNKLIICNDGCALPHEALLFGTTTKVGKAAAIGQFGEGLKLGILALVRAGHPITIRTGSEVWIPEIRDSAKFDAKVLVIDVKKSNAAAYKDKVWIEIGNIEYEAWLELRNFFTFLTKVGEKVNTPRGDILLDPAFKSRIYVKGIFVKNHPKAEFGYDLKSVQVDRDRRMIAEFDLQWELASIWRDAIKSHPHLFGKFTTMLQQNTSLEVKGYDDSPDFGATSLDPAARQQLVSQFVETHGKGVIPCATTEETEVASHAGLRSVIVPRGLAAILQAEMGKTHEVCQEHVQGVERVMGFDELSDNEKKTWDICIQMVAGAKGVTPNALRSKCDIVLFRGSTLGLHKDGRYLIAKGELLETSQCLATLIHEVAHDVGGGDLHGREMERLWTRVAQELLAWHPRMTM